MSRPSRFSSAPSSGFGSYGSRDGGGGRFGRKNDNDIVLKKPVWNSTTMKPFDKDFYRESAQAKMRPQSEVDDFLRKNSVTFKTDNYIRPVLDFSDFSIPETILGQFRKANYEKPTPIQAACWPTLMSGSNIVGIAQTGSGKTLGFMLPILVHIMNNHRYVRSFGREEPPGPIALVLAPTRELAQQIQMVAEEFGAICGIRNVVVYGGASKGPQIGQIRRGPEICIATPGRLLDLLSENLISLHKCTFLVLDEADRMLDMGFEPQIRKVIEQIRPDRQTAMFSATWPKEVRKLAEDFLSRYSQVTIGAAELTANPNIKQIIEVCEERDKEDRLREILKEIMSQRESKCIIFAETKRRVDQYSKYIRDLGHYCLAIHGDKKQSEREWVLNEFKKKARAILIATDVAARGINIEDIKFVVNIDFPNQTEDYIHRIGRTARSTNSGTAYTLITQENAKHVSKLLDVLRDANQEISESLMNFYNRYGRGRGGYGGNSRYGGSRYGGYSSGYGAQKRSYDDYGSSSNGYGSSSISRSDDSSSVKKGRWDSGPSVPTTNGTSAYTNGAAAAVVKQAYGPYPVAYAAQTAPPPPPPAENGSATSTATPAAATAATPAAAAAAMPAYYSAADYAQAYSLQYYQAMAAAAASTNWTQAAAAYAASGWKAPTA